VAVIGPDPADDPLQHHPDNPPPGYFDRCYFNICSPERDLFAVVGLGVYPRVGVVDGYVCIAGDGLQRNVRMSTASDDPTRALPLTVEVLEPLRRWRLGFADAESGLELDATWEASFDARQGQAIAVSHDDGINTSFEHYFQSGTYSGRLVVAGTDHRIDGWFGQRDRSWGIRRVQDRLGMHMWIGVSYPGGAVAVHYNEDRAGTCLHCDGVVDLTDGGRRTVNGLGHTLRLDNGELSTGSVKLSLDDGSTLSLEAGAASRGLYMDGAGYGGWQGLPRGPGYVERETWELNGVSPRSLRSALIDKLCDFKVDGMPGRGVFELAVSRSASFVYRPTLGPRA
jgi:hypothetical protein